MLSIKQKQYLVNKHYNENRTFEEISIKYLISHSTARKLCIDYKIYGTKRLISKRGQRNKQSNDRAKFLEPKDKNFIIL